MVQNTKNASRNASDVVSKKSEASAHLLLQPELHAAEAAAGEDSEKVRLTKGEDLGMGQNETTRIWTAFSPWFHLPIGFHFGHLFLTTTAT